MPMTTSQSPVSPRMSVEGFAFIAIPSRRRSRASRAAQWSVRARGYSLGKADSWSGGKTMTSEIRVLSSIATKEAYLVLVPEFERASGHKVTTAWAGTVEIMKRIPAGEVHDLIIVSSTELDELIKQGKIAAGSRLDIAKSGIGIAVRAGAPKPDISSAEALKKTLLVAKTVGYTSGPSG